MALSKIHIHLVCNVISLGAAGCQKPCGHLWDLYLLRTLVILSETYYEYLIQNTTFNNGSLGSRIDEERSEMRYVMWIAEFSESSNLWTHIALSGIPESMLVWVSVNTSTSISFFEMGVGLEWSQRFSSPKSGGLLEMQVQLDFSLSYKHIYLVCLKNRLLPLLQLT